MQALTEHIQLQVKCPTCPESYEVPLSVVEEAQHLLDEVGPCSVTASHECPAPYFAALVAPEAISDLRAALRAFERSVDRRGGLSVVEERPASIPEPAPTAKQPVGGPTRGGGALAVRVGRQLRRAADAVALAFELSRWENEGGAPADAE